ncbi:uncharacterized protein [Dermacentor albipictus]|uniref:uncharacterized protein n=1 Tax=Dermacentor albipictus TaxID=60249 RepID=UPI0031FE2942
MVRQYGCVQDSQQRFCDLLQLPCARSWSSHLQRTSGNTRAGSLEIAPSLRRHCCGRRRGLPPSALPLLRGGSQKFGVGRPALGRPCRRSKAKTAHISAAKSLPPVLVTFEGDATVHNRLRGDRHNGCRVTHVHGGAEPKPTKRANSSVLLKRKHRYIPGTPTHLDRDRKTLQKRPREKCYQPLIKVTPSTPTLDARRRNGRLGAAL